jgi:hypothetical protein
MSAEDWIGGEQPPEKTRSDCEMENVEITGKFTVELVKNKSNSNKRTIVKGEDGKQIGSTFDKELTRRLQSFAQGANLTITVDKSGTFWDIVDVRLADDAPVGDAKFADAPAPAAATDDDNTAKSAPTKKGPFGGRDLTYFIGSSARIVAALAAVGYYKESKDAIADTHKDTMLGALTLFNEANKRGE